MTTASKTEKRSQTVISEPRDLSSPALEQHLGEEIRKHAAQIIVGLVEKALEGGAVQAKFLFDFAGLASAPPPQSKGESLLTIMRREIQFQEQANGTIE